MSRFPLSASASLRRWRQGSKWGYQSMLEARLDRIIQVSKSILDEIQRGNKLSDILPQARFLAEINNDHVKIAWIQYEIHGKWRVPITAEPKLSIKQRKKATQVYDELHKTIDFDKLSAALKAGGISVSLSSIPLCQTNESVIQLEHFAMSKHAEIGKYIYGVGNVEDKVKISMALESERLLAAVRNAVHEYVSEVWFNAVQEKEYFDLIGPNFNIVTNNLDALETGVGQELMAALKNLRSTNPANWSASALVCRNVIIKLGDNLWKVPCKKYFSELDNRELDLVGEREKNRLYAYIDLHYKRIEQQEHKDKLKQLHGMVWRIWDIGSKAKHAIRHEEAKTIFVDTFEFVNNLDAITELKPLEKI